MIKVKDQNYLFVDLMDMRRSWVEDIRGGYIYLNCTEEQLRRFIRDISVYRNKTRK